MDKKLRVANVASNWELVQEVRLELEANFRLSSAKVEFSEWIPINAFLRFGSVSNFVLDIAAAAAAVDVAVRTSGAGPQVPGHAGRIGRSVADMAGKSGNSGSEIVIKKFKLK